jgi:ATP-dependent Clp endopeptidase proteolytic subunit ClpP
VTYPDVELLDIPEGASAEVIKDIVQTNTAILDFRSKIADLDTEDIERRKSVIELEKQELELERARSYAMRDVESYRHRGGIFTLYDDVTDYSVKQVINDISVWHSHAPKGAPLQLNINSYGGSVTDGFALFDTIRHVAEEGERKVKTVSLGITASMGGILLQAGDERVITPSSVLLIHEISYGTSGSTSSHRDKQNLADILTNRIISVLTERATITAEEFEEKWQRRDWWLSPAESLAFGFADRVAFN